MNRFVRTLVIHLPFAALLYLMRFHMGPLPTTALEVYLATLFVIFTIDRGWNGWREGWNRLGAWRAPVVAWFIVTLVAVAVAPDHIAGLGLWRAYVLEPLLVFLILADTVKTDDDRTALERQLFFSVIFVTLWAVFQFATGKGIPHPWDVAIGAGRRATGPFPFPNALSLFVAPIGAWAFATWSTKVRMDHTKIRNEIVALVAWCASFVAIALAKSEGGFAGLAVATLVVLLAGQRTRRIAITGFIATVCAVGLIVPLRTAVIREVTFHGWSGQVRLIIWRETWQMLKDRPFFGAGLGAYPVTMKPYHRAVAIEVFQYPHNIILNLWSETGLLGLIVFVWIVWTWVRSTGNPRQRSFVASTPPYQGEIRTPSLIRGGWGGLAPLLAILIHGLVDVPYFKNDLALVFWLLVFLTIVHPSTINRKRI